MSLLLYYWMKLINSSIFGRRFQISLPKCISYIVQFLGILNTEVRRPTRVIFYQNNIDFGHVLAFVYILGFCSLLHIYCLCVNV